MVGNLPRTASAGRVILLCDDCNQPVVEPQPGNAADSRMGGVIERGESSMAKVLVVDDDQEIRETLRLVLEDDGHEVIEAESGQSALIHLRTTPHPLVVLLDMLMPGMNGAAVLREIARSPELAARHRYILTTADNTAVQKTTESLLRTLSVVIVAKPFDVDVLLAAVAGAAQQLP